MHLPANLGSMIHNMLIPFLIIIIIVILLVPMNSYVKLYRRRKSTKGKIFCWFRKPSGGVETELCLVKGKCVYRGEDDYRKIKEPKDALDPRLGHEVYFLKKAESEAWRTKDGKTYSKRQWSEMKAKDDTLEGELIATGRPHIKIPMFGGSFWEPQVDVPVAEFVEGQTLEVDCVSVALDEFKADPQYNASMAGAILDEKLTKLFAWWSEYVEALEKQLAQKINPTILYILLGAVGLIGLACLFLVYKQNGTISHLSSQISHLQALLGFTDNFTG